MNEFLQRIEERDAARTPADRMMDLFVRMAAPDSPYSPWGRQRAQKLVEARRLQLIQTHAEARLEVKASW